eukprot:TRINITY_DN22790_c0_g1_i1.p1 TRINITY_DN22790_c0_g1~~TRINITY_DN22790_c0_g1_i1.p1  ORF type:complete len:643 (+),score=136.05 TRINITY_DN22790_c0_g1_i1:104-1930(+)
MSEQKFVDCLSACWRCSSSRSLKSILILTAILTAGTTLLSLFSTSKASFAFGFASLGSWNLEVPDRIASYDAVFNNYVRTVLQSKPGFCRMVESPNHNAIYASVPGPAMSTDRIRYLGDQWSKEQCYELCTMDDNCTSAVWHSSDAGAYRHQCFTRVDGHYDPVAENGIHSARRVCHGYYVGCFQDDAAARDLDGMHVRTFALQTCVDHCVGAGTQYAALQNGTDCYCGNKPGRLGELDAARCMAPCGLGVDGRMEFLAGVTDIVKRMCGGSNVNTVYGVTAESQAAVVERLAPPPLPKELPSLSAFVRQQHAPYDSVCTLGTCITELHSRTRRDINVFIPVHGREAALRTSLFYLEAAALRAAPAVRVSIVVIEVAPEPELRGMYRSPFVEYIFLPDSATRTTGAGDRFPKSLAYNMGFLMAREAKWNIFHDVDALVEETFFEELYGRYLSADGVTWLQPYHRRFVPINESYVSIVQDLAKQGQLYDLSSIPYMLHGPDTVSPGGSILVRRDIFQAVGGYDPELFFGYAPEDAFFWAKLNTLFTPEPLSLPFRMYHMWHPRTRQEPGEPDFYRVTFMEDVFLRPYLDNFTKAEQLGFLKVKEELLKL